MRDRIPRCSILNAACLLAVAVAAATAHAQCNSTPIASGDNAEAASAPILIDVLANDTEPDGEALTVTVLASTCPASTEIVLDLIRLTPNPSIDANCTLTYRIEDETHHSTSATVAVKSIAVLFGDNFESGNANQWDSTCPGSGC